MGDLIEKRGAYSLSSLLYDLFLFFPAYWALKPLIIPMRIINYYAMFWALERIMRYGFLPPFLKSVANIDVPAQLKLQSL